MRVRYRPVASAAGEAGSLSLVRGGGGGGGGEGEGEAGPESRVEIGHRSMRTYYKQNFRPSSSLGAARPELHALMLQYAKAGVLAAPVGGARHPHGIGARHERSHFQVERDKKMFMRQGITNNKTMNGMKHFKNQSLNF
jgi:hypothetical protein